MPLNYVMLGSKDVEKARGFYDAVLPAIGGKVTAEYMPHVFFMNGEGAGAFGLRPRSTKKPHFLAMATWLGLLARPKKKLMPRIRLPWLKVARMRVTLAHDRSMGQTSTVPMSTI